MSARPDPEHLYCDDCDEWTRINHAEELFCSVCGTDYTCGECGGDINRDGSCVDGTCRHA